MPWELWFFGGAASFTAGLLLAVYALALRFWPEPPESEEDTPEADQPAGFGEHATQALALLSDEELERRVTECDLVMWEFELGWLGREVQ
jgi:hypothetical protein